MPKITIGETTLTVEREPNDPKFYGVTFARGESNFLYWLKGILNAKPYELDLIKKRVQKDGHLMGDEYQQYLRTRKIKIGKPYVMIFNGHYQIRGIEEDWNAGKAVLTIERGTGERGKCLLGFYNRFGYNIHETDHDGKLTGKEPLYEAGNSPYDSTLVVSLDRAHETLGTLRKWCVRTGKELAIEHGIPWGGCQRESDPDEMMHPEELE